jgi:threonine dehydrogenase-like Zn-dependent dehydrogenase
MPATPDIRTPVLIVGSGLAGLTTALMLAWRGVRPLLVERHADTSKNPRARGERMRPDRDRNAVEEIPRSPNGATWGKDLQVQAEETDYLGVAFGYRYRSEAILQDVPDDGSRIENPEQPSGRPGTRGAHVAFEYKGKEVSSVDLIGRDFVLLTGPEGAAWARAGTTLAYRCGIPLSIYRIGSDLLDVNSKWAERYGVTAAGAVLLRPDGFIAWRARTAASSALTTLREALARIMFRSVEVQHLEATG